MTRYFLNTFSWDSWSNYQSLKPPSLGTVRPRDDVQLGDVFLCYVRQEGHVPGQWVGAERVISPMYFDDHRYYHVGVWPYRWKVEPAVPRRTYGEGIPGRRLRDSMRMFANIDARNWGSALRTQGREIPADDGELLIAELSGS